MPRDSADAISIDELLAAYRLGYFPMARSASDRDIVWVLPEERGVIFLNEARAPRRLRKTAARDPYRVTIDQAFRDVVAACAEATPRRPDTWINDAILDVYCELHFRGLAHSVECWRGERLVGGLYGLPVGAVFCGESMFARATDASKVAFTHLIANLREAGFAMIDAQFHNPHLEQFGLRAITNAEYQAALRVALRDKPGFPTTEDQLSTERVLQLITQTS